MCRLNYQIEVKLIMLIMNYFQDFIFDLDLQICFLIFSFCVVRLADSFSWINSASTINSAILRFLIAFYFQALKQEMKTFFSISLSLMQLYTLYLKFNMLQLSWSNLLQYYFCTSNGKLYSLDKSISSINISSNCSICSLIEFAFLDKKRRSATGLEFLISLLCILPL